MLQNKIYDRETKAYFGNSVMHSLPPIIPSSIIYGVTNLINGHFNRKEQEKARWEQQVLTREIEGKRREIQKEQMMLSILNRDSNQEHQRSLAMENRQFQAILQKQNQEFQREIEEFRQRVNLEINQRNIEFQKWRFEEQKRLQLHITQLNQEFQREMLATQHQNAKELIYEEYRINRESPIINLAKDLIDEDPSPNGVTPLKILLAPPELDFEPNRPSVKEKERNRDNIETSLAIAIRKFINQGYDIHNQEHPTDLIDKAWQSKKFGGGSAIKTLHKWLKPVPTLILESGFARGKLNFQYWYWDGSQSKPENGFILDDLVFYDFVKTSARNRTVKLQAEITKKSQAGISNEDITNDANLKNLQNLEKEAKAIAQVEESSLSAEEKEKYIQEKQEFYLSQYIYNGNDEDAFYDYLGYLELEKLEASCRGGFWDNDKVDVGFRIMRNFDDRNYKTISSSCKFHKSKSAIKATVQKYPHRDITFESS